MHCLRIASIVVNNVNRDSLAEVGLETVYAAVQNGFQFASVPFYGIRVGEVYKTHTSLPVVGLPYASAVCSLKEIAVCCTLFEERGSLCDVRVDPCADVQAFVMIFL